MSTSGFNGSCPNLEMNLSPLPVSPGSCRSTGSGFTSGSHSGSVASMPLPSPRSPNHYRPNGMTGSIICNLTGSSAVESGIATIRRSATIKPSQNRFFNQSGNTSGSTLTRFHSMSMSHNPRNPRIPSIPSSPAPPKPPLPPRRQGSQLLNN